MNAILDSGGVRVLFAALALLGPGGTVLADTPAGTLTLSVEEQANGDVRFQLSGTASMKRTGSFSTTPYDSVSNLPPHTAGMFEHFSLPAGLSLDANGSGIPLNDLYLYAPGYWSLGSFSSGTLPADASVSGSGSITTDAIAFSNFVPGTHVVSDANLDMTFQVTAYTPPPAPFARLQAPGRVVFPRTPLRRLTRPKPVPVRNTGTGPAAGLMLRPGGPARRDYRVTRLPSSTLAAGATTRFQVRFRPLRKGARRAEVRILSANAAPRTLLLHGVGR